MKNRINDQILDLNENLEIIFQWAYKWIFIFDEPKFKAMKFDRGNYFYNEWICEKRKSVKIQYVYNTNKINELHVILIKIINEQQICNDRIEINPRKAEVRSCTCLLNDKECEMSQKAVIDELIRDIEKLDNAINMNQAIFTIPEVRNMSRYYESLQKC